MATVGQYFYPSEIIPEPGIYRCTKCSHTKFFSTDIKGLSFPQDHYTLAKWELIKKIEKPAESLNKRSRRAKRENFLGTVLKTLRVLGRPQHPA